MARTDLPSSVAALQETVARQQALLEAKDGELAEQRVMIDERDALISFYREWKRLIESQRFGARSERMVLGQGHLFNEVEVEAAEDADGATDDVSVPSHVRMKRGRRPLPDDPARNYDENVRHALRTRRFSCWTWRRELVLQLRW